MRKKKKLWNSVRLLHPGNLSREVDAYGYHFSWKTHVLLMLFTLAGIGAVGLLFQLSPVFFVILAAAVACAVPVLILDMYKRMYEQKRFADAAAYMEQMLYSFQKTGKVISAWKECQESFPKGQMRQTLEHAVRHLEEGKPETAQGVLRESFAMIEARYDCQKLHIVHELLAGMEDYGGEAENSILLLLEDIENWKKRGYRLQAEKKKSHTDNVISIVCSVALCAAALYVLDQMKHMFAAESSLDVFRIPVIQVSSTVFLVVLLFVFVKSVRNLTDDWLKENTVWEQEYLVKSYDMIRNYDKTREQRKSLLLAAPFAVLFCILILTGKSGWCLLSAVLLLFLLLQHRIGYHIAKKDVTNAMYLSLPQWLMEMTLLLQNNNVQVSLMKSMEDAPELLKKELKALMERLKQNPGKLQAYTSFCGGFDLPEVSSCMKMLHAVCENGTGNIKVQMQHLLERVNEMQSRADDIANEGIAFRMKLIFSYPVVAATAKLLVDLTVGMIVMLQFLGSMGGH